MTRMVCCLAALLWLALPLSAAKKPEVKRIYMFGFAASLRDSTAFQTDIQTIDSAWIDPTHKMLVDRALYSLQLQYHMETEEHRKNTVCSIFFGTNPRKVQRKWAKVKKRYEKDPLLSYQILPKERFAFKAEQYLAPIIGDEVFMPDSARSTTAPAGQNPQNAPKK